MESSVFSQEINEKELAIVKILPCFRNYFEHNAYLLSSEQNHSYKFEISSLIIMATYSCSKNSKIHMAEISLSITFF